MTPPGHLAFAYLMSRQRALVAHRMRCAAFAMFGALLPDIIDKALLLSGVYPWGRTIGHSLITWALVAGHIVAASIVLRTPRRSLWILLGVFSHFLADLTNDMFEGVFHHSYALSSWFLWPIKNPDQWEWRVKPLVPAVVAITLYELAVIALAIVLMIWDRRFLTGDVDRLEVLDDHSGEYAFPRGDDQS